MARGSQHGKSNNPKGKPKGIKSKRTIEWEKLGDFITDAGARKFAKIMNEADDDSFAELYLKALNYFKPKITHQITEEADPVKEIKFVVKK